MNAYLWALLGAVLGLLLCLAVLRRRQGMAGAASHGDTPMASRVHTAAARPATGAGTPAKFHAVTLRPCLEPCDAVQALAGQRFLSREAPSLPLENCDQARCECTYRHLSDRREQGDRRSGWNTFGAFSNTLAQGERRSHNSDRREED